MQIARYQFRNHRPLTVSALQHKKSRAVSVCRQTKTARMIFSILIALFPRPVLPAARRER